MLSDKKLCTLVSEWNTKLAAEYKVVVSVLFLALLLCIPSSWRIQSVFWLTKTVTFFQSLSHSSLVLQQVPMLCLLFVFCGAPHVWNTRCFNDLIYFVLRHLENGLNFNHGHGWFVTPAQETTGTKSNHAQTNYWGLWECDYAASPWIATFQSGGLTRETVTHNFLQTYNYPHETHNSVQTHNYLEKL